MKNFFPGPRAPRRRELRYDAGPERGGRLVPPDSSAQVPVAVLHGIFFEER